MDNLLVLGTLDVPDPLSVQDNHLVLFDQPSLCRPSNLQPQKSIQFILFYVKLKLLQD